MHAWRISTMVVVVLFLGLLLSRLTGSTNANGAPCADAEQSPLELVPWKQGLMLPAVGTIGRGPIVTNPVFAAWAAGKDWPPKAGDKVKLPNGSTVAWESLPVTNDG